MSWKVQRSQPKPKGGRKRKKHDQKVGFNQREVLKIDHSLRSEGNLFEATLFHTAIDTMLRSSDLLPLKVKDVVYQSGEIKDKFIICQKKTGVDVTVVLTPSTKLLLQNYIEQFNKSEDDYLFTIRSNGIHIGANWYRELVKKWARRAGIKNVEQYSGHSTRRTKAIFMYQSGDKIELISKVLGHTSIVATIVYLGIETDEVVNQLQQHSIWEQDTKNEISDIFSSKALKAWMESRVEWMKKKKPSKKQRRLLQGYELAMEDISFFLELKENENLVKSK